MRFAKLSVLFAVLGISLGLATAGTALASTVHVVDPGESIQAAVDAAEPGDTVLLAAGIHPLPETPVSLSKPITILGEAGSEMVGTGAWSLAERGFICDSPEAGVAVRGLGFRNLSQPVKVLMPGTTVEDCEFTNCGTVFWHWGGGAVNVQIGPESAGAPTRIRGNTFHQNFLAIMLAAGSDVEVADNTVLGFGFVGVGFGGRGPHRDLLIENNTIRGVRGAISRIYLPGGDTKRVTARGNLIEDCYGGIENYFQPEVDGFVIENNTIINTVADNQDGIRLQHVKNAEVRGNVVSGAYRNLWGYNCTNAVIEDNQFLDSMFQSVAIFGGGSDGNTIQGNLVTVQPTGWDGIIVSEQSNATVVGNTVTDFLSETWFAAALRLWDVHDSDASRNVFVNTPGGWGALTLTAGCTNNTLIQNDFSASGKPGYAEYDGDGNLVYTGGDPCILLVSNTVGNHVVASLSPTHSVFPPGTNLCTQVQDMSGLNEIRGWAACERNPNWADILDHLNGPADEGESGGGPAE